MNESNIVTGGYMDDWYDAETTAKHLGIGLSNLYALAQSGKIPGHRLGKKWKFNKAEIDAWMRANKPIEEFFLSAQAWIDGNDLLRAPQQEAHAAALRHYENPSADRFSIIQLPVGCGKSGLIACLPFQLARGRVLVIAPNLTIRDGLAKNLDVSDRRSCFWHKCNVLNPQIMMAGPFAAILDGPDANIHDCDRSHIVLTNIQQLASCVDRWLPQFPHDYFDLVLVDEGHHSAAASFQKVFEHFPKAKIINLTATPFRSDRKALPGELVYRFTFKQAMIKGYIKRLQAGYVAPEELYFTCDGEETRYTLDDVLDLKDEDWFSKGVALSPECNKNIVNASLEKLEKMRMTGTQHQIIAVACSVRHAKAIRSLYEERGYNAAEIHSQMPEDKKAEVLQRLRAGLLDCIVQVQMLGEGFDHPKLSVAAIFRPFRSLPPYIQFIGRVMRVVVQNDPRHPDNLGWIVTHIGMNQDRLMDDFKDLERDDQLFLQELLDGEPQEDEVPAEVREGRKQTRIAPDMIVNRELFSSFLEANFLDADDDALLVELKAQAEALGFDGEKLAQMIRSQKAALGTGQPQMKQVSAPAPFPVSPQRARREAKRRLDEEVKRAAKVLVNRMGYEFNGREIPVKLGTGTQGNNFVASVQLVYRHLQKRLGIKSGQLGTLTTEQLQAGMDALEEIVNDLTRVLKVREKGHEERQNADTP